MVAEEVVGEEVVAQVGHSQQANEYAHGHECVVDEVECLTRA